MKSDPFAVPAPADWRPTPGETVIAQRYHDFFGGFTTTASVIVVNNQYVKIRPWGSRQRRKVVYLSDLRPLK